MTATDALYQTRLDVIQALATARANLTEAKEKGYEGMAETWEFRIKGLTEQLQDIQESIEREEGK